MEPARYDYDSRSTSTFILLALVAVFMVGCMVVASLENDLSKLAIASAICAAPILIFNLGRVVCARRQWGCEVNDQFIRWWDSLGDGLARQLMLVDIARVEARQSLDESDSPPLAIHTFAGERHDIPSEYCGDLTRIAVAIARRAPQAQVCVNDKPVK